MAQHLTECSAVPATHEQTDALAPAMDLEDRVLRLELSTGATIAARVVHKHPAPERQCLLIHGNPGSMADWAEVIALLPTGTAVAAIDLPGFGLSPRPEGAHDHLSLRELASHVLAVCDALSWKKPILVGHSHGAAIAFALAAASPERVAALVLVGSLGSPAHLYYRLLAAPGMMWVARLLASTFRVALLRPISRSAIHRSVADACFPERPSDDLQQRVFELFCATPHTLVCMIQLARGNPCQQVLDAAARTSCPVLFLHGRLDDVVPFGRAETVHRRIVEGGGISSFRLLESAGHMLPWFQPAAVADAVDAVLAGHASPALAVGNSLAP